MLEGRERRGEQKVGEGGKGLQRTGKGGCYNAGYKPSLYNCTSLDRSLPPLPPPLPGPPRCCCSDAPL